VRFEELWVNPSTLTTYDTATRLERLLRFSFFMLIFNLIMFLQQDPRLSSRPNVPALFWSFARHPSLAIVVFRLRVSAFPSTCHNAFEKEKCSRQYHL